MKLTDERIEEITERFEQGCFGSKRTVLEFARAIEAACQPRWLPMESAPDDTVKKVIVWYKSGLCYLGDWNGAISFGESISSSGIEAIVIGWMPLPEVEL